MFGIYLTKMILLFYCFSILFHLINCLSPSGYGKAQNLFKDDDFVQNKEHISHHMDGINIDDASKEELEFHFFHLHDMDKNKLLDGLEILHALDHNLEESILAAAPDHRTPEEEEEWKRETKMLYHGYLIDTVDMVLSEMDKDSNGYISYEEYIKERRYKGFLGALSN